MNFRHRGHEYVLGDAECYIIYYAHLKLIVTRSWIHYPMTSCGWVLTTCIESGHELFSYNHGPIRIQRKQTTMISARFKQWFHSIIMSIYLCFDFIQKLACIHNGTGIQVLNQSLENWFLNQSTINGLTQVKWWSLCFSSIQSQ